MEPEYGYWLAGFLDGEGCFDIACQRHKRGARRHAYHYCRLSVTLRADDAALLRDCAARLGGHVYLEARNGNPAGANPRVRWEVSRREELRGIVELLDRYPPRSKKARDYGIRTEEHTS